MDRPGVRELLEDLRETGASAENLGEALESSTGRLIDGEESEAAQQEIRRARDVLAPLAARFEQDLEGFLAEIALGAEVDTWDPRAQRVSLLTLHAAKGLEFPVVFLVGCVDGLLPLSFGDKDEDSNREEERRLFFVGLTRAQSRLFLSHPKKRTWRGRTVAAVASPFLEDIDKALLEVQESGAPKGEAQEVVQQLSLFSQ